MIGLNTIGEDLRDFIKGRWHTAKADIAAEVQFDSIPPFQAIIDAMILTSPVADAPIVCSYPRFSKLFSLRAWR